MNDLQLLKSEHANCVRGAKWLQFVTQFFRMESVYPELNSVNDDSLNLAMRAIEWS